MLTRHYNSWLVVTLFLLSQPIGHGNKPVYPAEIVGRNLNYPKLGWLGHVGITTAPMNSPAGMNQVSYQVIEVLKEPVVGQINSRDDFKSRSPYWGSRYGIADLGVNGYNLLVEANHQRWWCPTYTSSTAYVIGEGIPTTGKIIKCGTWRCDTYAWWAFYSAGYDIVPGQIMLPRKVYFAFPAVNPQPLSVEHNERSILMDESEVLSSYSATQLNEMTFEQFEKIADISLELETPEHILAEMRFAKDESLNETKRGIFIDRLAIGGKHPYCNKFVISF